MPAILRYKGYRFFFYSNECDPLEPLHVHVVKGNAGAKFWVSPRVSLAESFGLKSHELTELEKVVRKNRRMIERAWHVTLANEPVARNVWFDVDSMWIELADGRTLSVPLAYFPRLLGATPRQRKACVIGAGGRGLHWENIDEDISVRGLLLGVGDVTKEGVRRRSAERRLKKGA